MKVEILTIFFGPEHLEMMFRTMLPSLMHSTNIPAMLRDKVELTHNVYCDNDNSGLLELYKSISNYKVNIHVNSARHDDHPGLANPFKESLQREVLTVMAPCDHVFGSGLWRSIRDLKKGDYLICGHPRIDASKLDKMHNFLQWPNRDDDNRDLVSFCMNEMAHPMVEHGKRTREPYWYTLKQKDHWETHFAEPPPVAWWGAPYMMNAWSGYILYSHWEVIDHEMVEHCRQAATLKWIDDSRKFFWAEFTNPDTYHPRTGRLLQSSFRYECMRLCADMPLRWYF